MAHLAAYDPAKLYSGPSSQAFLLLQPNSNIYSTRIENAFSPLQECCQPTVLMLRHQPEFRTLAKIPVALLGFAIVFYLVQPLFVSKYLQPFVAQPNMSSASVEVLTATAAQLRTLLEKGKVTSVELVSQYLQQIERHNHRGAKLNAMISLVPQEVLFATARALDYERANGHPLRGLFHGIPIIVKDNMCTSPGFRVPTTSGTIAFKNSIATSDAECVQKFIAAGAIILGKANLDVLAGMKGSTCPTGWSEIGGQTQSAYVKGGVVPGDTFLGHSLPGGSSAGSAVAVSAGFAPVSLGTETDGSIMGPADRASLYSIKVTPGSASVAGTLPYSPASDSLGPLAKSPIDVADMLTVLHDGHDYSQYLNHSWANLKIGFLDPMEWKSSAGASKPMKGYVEQVASEFSAATDRIAMAGAKTEKWVSLRRFGGDNDDSYQEQIMWHDFAPNFAKFVTDNFDNPPVQSLQELVEFNNRHKAETLPAECPDQDILLDVVKHEHQVPDSSYELALENLRHNNRDMGLEATLKAHDLDIILGAPTGRFPTIAAAAGYPCGTLPLGYSKQNGRPFGVMGVVRPGREDLLVGLMARWYEMFGPPMPPPLLMEVAGTKI